VIPAPAGATDLETWLLRQQPYDGPTLPAPQNMIYTSGTTGHPKGVVYSHRSNVLHSFAVNSAAGFGLTDQVRSARTHRHAERARVLPARRHSALRTAPAGVVEQSCLTRVS